LCSIDFSARRYFENSGIEPLYPVDKENQMQRLAILSSIMVLMALCGARAQNVEYVGSLNFTAGVGDVFTTGNHAYLSDYVSGLDIIDVSLPSCPSNIGGCYIPGDAHAVYIVGNYAYLADYAFGLYIISISNLSNPIIVGHCDLPGNAYDLFVQDNYAYVADYTAGLQILDVSSPINPIIVGSYDTPYLAVGIFVEGEYAYISDFQSLLIINISNPAVPNLVGSYAGFNDNVYVSGNYAYMAGGDLLIVDISNAANPTYVARFVTPGEAVGIFVADNYAYVADYASGLQIINIVDPPFPILIGCYDTPYHAYSVSVMGDYIYVADWSSLQILRFNPMGIDENNSTPNSFSLSQSYPNPFNAATTISYTIPNATKINLDIYDILGRKIQTLVNDDQQPGPHHAIWNAEDTPSGTYFYRLKAGEKTETNRMLLLK
jgi:hypothetical protein